MYQVHQKHPNILVKKKEEFFFTGSIGTFSSILFVSPEQSRNRYSNLIIIIFKGEGNPDGSLKF